MSDEVGIDIKPEEPTSYASEMAINWDDPDLVIGDYSLKTQHHYNQKRCQTDVGSLPHLQSSQLDYLVRDIRNLPERVINRLKAVGLLLLLPEGEALDLLECVRSQYLCISQWLEFYLLGRSELEAELFHTEKICYKNHAELDAALLKLIQELRPKSELLQETSHSDTQLWFILLISNCWREMSELGITGTPREISKTDLIKQARKYNRTFKRQARASAIGKDSIDEIDSSQAKFDVIYWTQQIESLFFREAVEVAQFDPYFRKHHFNPYWKLRTRFWNEVEADDMYQVIYMGSDGKIFVTGRGKKKPKGFTPPKRPRGRPPKSSNIKNS